MGKLFFYFSLILLQMPIFEKEQNLLSFISLVICDKE